MSANRSDTSFQASPPAGEFVILLHGLARSAKSMSSMADALEAAGYGVCNIAYPSRKHAVEMLASDFVAPAIAKHFPDRKQRINFVTHSLGGIIVRQLVAAGAIGNIGRAVMLSPPNQGSEIVDHFGNWWLFNAINGPAGKQIGTGAQALPKRLGSATFELGIITGNRSINLLLSALIPGENDGKVSIANAKLSGMKDFLVIPSSHPFIMKNPQAIRQTLHFLQHGSFFRNPLRQSGQNEFQDPPL